MLYNKEFTIQEKLEILKQKKAIEKLLKDWEEEIISAMVAFGDRYPGVEIVPINKKRFWTQEATIKLKKYLSDGLIYKNERRPINSQETIKKHLKNKLRTKTHNKLTNKELNKQIDNIIRDCTVKPKARPNEVNLKFY